jgi:pimeloyl-ACP methyl ester carboxylesterase
MKKFVHTKDVSLCTESVGNPAHPAVLLLMGANASMVWWDREFCERLANQGFFVIRYDHRDVGESTTYPPGEPPYSVLDMVDDALSIVDAYSIEKAHLIGMSLGGMLAQLVAIQHPGRVLSLTLIASSVWDHLPDLPIIDQRILDYHAQASSLDWQDKQQVVAYLVEGWRLLNGSKHSFDQVRASQLAQTEIQRACNLLSMYNHALLKGGEQLYGRAKEIALPTLIIHGTEDIVLPYPHALALLEAIPHAQLLPLAGRGHELHYQDWNLIIEAITQQTNAV